MQWRPILTRFIKLTDPFLKALMPRVYPYTQLIESIAEYLALLLLFRIPS
jgi:hypothetical protein